jgi:hypothetical protein
LAWAEFLAFVLLMSFLWLLPWSVLMYQGRQPTRGFTLVNDLAASPENGLAIAINAQGMWQRWLSLLRSGPGPLLWGFATMALLSALQLYLLIRFSAWIVKRTWQEHPVSTRALWWRDKLFKPVLFRKQLRGWLRWELHHNPIGWLEQRSWSGRLVLWSWLAVVVCVYSSLFSNLSVYQRGFHVVQSFLASLLAGSIAVSAAGSFRRERETGVLELLLVAPLREWEIIAGRVRGLWIQFLPAVALLFTVWLYCATFLSTVNELPSVVCYVITFATLPVVGLYFSLTKTNFMAALIWTLLVQAVIPSAVLQAVQFNHPEDTTTYGLLAQLSVQLAVAAFLGRRLLLVLKRREFVKVPGLG